MSEKLTHKEHMARAMLMGYIYDWRDGTYCPRIGWGEELSPEGAIDCLTFKPVGRLDIKRRMDKAGVNPGFKWREPLHETPWARMDEEDGGE